MSDYDQSYIVSGRDLPKQNHEDKMSNPNTAEEIEKELRIKVGKTVTFYEGIKLSEPSANELCWKVIDIAQEHTAQTLDRLKGDVENLPKSASIQTVLQLIEDI